MSACNTGYKPLTPMLSEYIPISLVAELPFQQGINAQEKQRYVNPMHIISYMSVVGLVQHGHIYQSYNKIKLNWHQNDYLAMLVPMQTSSTWLGCRRGCGSWS